MSPAPRERIEPARYPAVPLRDFVPLPTAVFPLFIGRENTKGALDQAAKSRREVVLVVQKDAGVDEPGPQDVHGIGLFAQLDKTEQMDDGTLRVMVEAGRRVAIRRFAADTGSYQADVEDAGEAHVVEAAELVESTLKRFEGYAAANDIRMPKGWQSPEQARDPGRIADAIGMNIALWLKDRQVLLATVDPMMRLQRVHDLLGTPSIPLSPAFDTTRRRAIAAATRRSHRYATLEHLLLALTDDADASAVLRVCNADLAALKADLLSFLGSERENIFVEPGTEAKPTPAFRRVGHRAQLSAQELGRAAVTGANALVGLFPETRSPAVRLLDKQGRGVPRFMVLDDITSSFDAGHQFALMDVMRTLLRYGAVPDGLQFIILSHDTSLEKYFDKLNGTADWHHQKLQGMPPKGRLMVSAQEADRLKTQALQHLNAGQIDIGAPFLRQYLEYKLGQIIAKLEVPVPPDYAARGDKRTLSTYVDAISEAVKLYQAANRCVLAPQQIIDLQNHHAPSIVGNFVSHYETGAGTPFNAYALLGVLQSIDALADCFTYVDPANNQKRFYRRLDRR